MDHVDLTPYPFPEGIAIPRLMPFQEYPWNGDGYLATEVLRLKEAHGLTSAIETGTCLGTTTLWLARNFGWVQTIEIHGQYYQIATQRLKEEIRTRVCWGPSSEWLPRIFDACSPCEETAALCFLDAHWNEHCPLLDELDIIAQSGFKPCILIHDFQVPGTDFGYDRMPDGRPFTLDLIRSHLDAIYGEGGWKHNYPTKVEGARRGWISIEPIPAHAPKD